MRKGPINNPHRGRKKKKKVDLNLDPIRKKKMRRRMAVNTKNGAKVISSGLRKERQIRTLEGRGPGNLFSKGKHHQGRFLFGGKRSPKRGALNL